MRHFCTYFDSHYLPQALALYESLERHCPGFRLWALCLDDASHHVLARLALPHLEAIPLEEFERGDDALLAAKANRSRVEYYFTCTPSLLLHVLRRETRIELLTYLDADLYFFSSPEPLFAEMGRRSLLILENRYPPALGHTERYGKFNVGFLSFRRDAQGLGCLEWWRERCLEWCYDRCEAGRYADQKYLDQWPELFPEVCIPQRPGAGLAPVNLDNYTLRCHGDTVTVDGDPLLFYHFSGLKKLGLSFYKTGLKGYGVHAHAITRRRIYRPYVQAVLRAAGRVQSSLPAAVPAFGTVRPLHPRQAQWRALCAYVSRVRASPTQLAGRLRRVLRGEVAVVMGERVWC